MPLKVWLGVAMRTLQFCNLIFSAVQNSGLWACSASLRGGTRCQPAPAHQSPITLWVLVSELTWESCAAQSPAESLDSGCWLLRSACPSHLINPVLSSLICLEAHSGGHLRGTFGDHIYATILNYGPCVSVFSVVI